MMAKKPLFKLVVLVLLVGVVRMVQAQERVLTLDDCIKIALENNKQILIAQEKLNQAKARKSEASGGYLPTISAGGSYTYNHEINTINFMDREIAIGKRETIAGRLSLQQPLYMGGKIYEFNQQADLNLELVRLDYEKLKDDLIYQVKQGFYTILLAKHLVRINQEAYKVTESHLRVSQALYNEGKISNYEVSRVKVQLANQKTNLIKAQNNLKITIDAQYNLMGWEPSTETEFIGQLGFVEKLYKDYETGLNQALWKRIEIRQLILQEELSDSMVSIAQSGYLPNLFLNSTFSRQNSSGFSADTFWTNNWTTSLNLNITLFEGFTTKAKVKQAQSQREQLKLSRTQLIETIKLEVKQDYFNLNQAKENIVGQGDNVDMARDNLRIAQERYKLGLMSDLEVRDAELTLTQAETNFYQAVYDYLIAQAKLEKAIGDTLE